MRLTHDHPHQWTLGGRWFTHVPLRCRWCGLGPLDDVYADDHGYALAVCPCGPLTWPGRLVAIALVLIFGSRLPEQETGA